MPITTTVRGDGGVVVSLKGPFNLEELLETNAFINQKLHIDQDVPYEIWDWSNCDVSQVSITSDWEPLQKTRPNNPDTLVVIVVKDDLMFGFSRVWQTFASDEYPDIAVVYSLAEADAWLNEKQQ